MILMDLNKFQTSFRIWIRNRLEKNSWNGNESNPTSTSKRWMKNFSKRSSMHFDYFQPFQQTLASCASDNHIRFRFSTNDNSIFEKNHKKYKVHLLTYVYCMTLFIKAIIHLRTLSLCHFATNLKAFLTVSVVLWWRNNVETLTFILHFSTDKRRNSWRAWTGMESRTYPVRTVQTEKVLELSLAFYQT